MNLHGLNHDKALCEYFITQSIHIYYVIYYGFIAGCGVYADVNCFKNGFYFFKKLAADKNGSYVCAYETAESLRNPGYISFLRTSSGLNIEIFFDKNALSYCGNSILEIFLLYSRDTQIKSNEKVGQSVFPLSLSAYKICTYPNRFQKSSVAIKLSRQHLNHYFDISEIYSAVLLREGIPLFAAFADKSFAIAPEMFTARQKSVQTDSESISPAAPAHTPDYIEPEKTEAPKNTENRQNQENRQKREGSQSQSPGAAAVHPTSLVELFRNYSAVPFDPFGTTNPAYKWFALTEAQMFMGILGSLNISLPTDLGKNAYEALSMYGHLLLGSYTDENSGRKFLIIGVPSPDINKSCAYNYRYNAARWAKSAVQYHSSQNTGYHLYYIDAKSTALVKVVLK